MKDIDIGDLSMELYINGIYLDNGERRKIVQKKHECIIDQLQFYGGEEVIGPHPKIKLGLNHPVNEIVFALQECYVDNQANGNLPAIMQNQWNDYGIRNPNGPMFNDSQISGHPIHMCNVLLNKIERYEMMSGKWHNKLQPWIHHSRIPWSADGKTNGINVYSFSLDPEDMNNPNGACNMSRIDEFEINLSLNNINNDNTGIFYIYARNYNLLKIQEGIGGLAYCP